MLGKTSFQEFKELYGEPSFTSTFDDYIYYSYEHAVIPPAGTKKFLLRELVSIKLDENNKIKFINFSDITKKPTIIPDPDKSNIKGSELSFIGQLLYNLKSGSFVE